MSSKRKSRRPDWKRVGSQLWPYLAPHRMRLIGASSFMFVAVAMKMLEPLPLKIVIDHVLVPHFSSGSQFSESTAGISDGGGSAQNAPEVMPGIDSLAASDPGVLLGLCVLGIVIIAAVGALVEYRRAVGFAWIGNRVVTELRRDVFQHLQSLSLSFHNRSRAGDLTVRLVGDLNMIRDVAVTAFLPLVGNILVLLGMSTIMLWLHWQLGLLAISVFPLFWFSATRSSRKIHAAAKKQRSCEGALAATANESLTAVKVVQALSLEDHFAAAFGEQSQKSMKDGVKTSRLSAALERKVDVLIALATALVLWQGSRYVMAGELSIGGLVVFLTYLKRGFKPLQNFAKYTGRLSKSLAAADRVMDILEESPDVHEASDAKVAPLIRGKIEFCNVTFGYNDEAPVLRNLSLEIEPGERIAVVGSSGAGKSTLLSLISRLHDPRAGSLRIDGEDIRSWTLDSLRTQQSIVMQENGVFAGTIQENILLVAPAATRDEIEQAAKTAGAHEFIQRLPQGYDSLIGERGANLSRGQVQRLAIARATLLACPILLVDEPTTGLDEKNERLVVDAILRASEGRTTLIVTHELGLAAKADRILVLKGGRSVEFGSHHELVSLGGHYAKMLEGQKSGRQSYALQS